MTAAIEGDVVVDLTPEPPTVEFAGRRFHIPDQGIGLLSLMKFATIARTGVDAESMEGIATLYTLLQSCIAADEWEAFEVHAMRVAADGETLMFVVRDAIKAAAGRPTQQHSLSPDGLPTTGTSSAGGSSSPGSPPIRQGDPRVQADLEARGRPDLAQVVVLAREAASTRTSPR